MINIKITESTKRQLDSLRLSKEENYSQIISGLFYLLKNKEEWIKN